eukprot:5613733-Prymnesium_polylepis.1
MPPNMAGYPRPHQSATLPVRHPPLESRTGVHRSGSRAGSSCTLYDYVTGKRLHRRHRAKVRLPGYALCTLSSRGSLTGTRLVQA